MGVTQTEGYLETYMIESTMQNIHQWVGSCMKAISTTFPSLSSPSNNFSITYNNTLEQEGYGEAVIYLQHLNHKLVVVRSLMSSHH